MVEASPRAFQLLPAIDLIGGRVVRLEQGNFDRATEYSDRPADVADRFASEGAAWLHVVDLDGARAGRPVQTESIVSVIAKTAGRARVEASGGLRTIDVIDAALAAGCARVVLGTAAIGDPKLLAQVVRRHGADQIAVAVDVRDGLALGEGWRSGALGISPMDHIQRLSDAGVTTFEVTAIDRDGTLGGPDLGLLESLVALGQGEIIASGGVHSAEDLRAVRDAGCAGAIVGKALYDGSLTVRAALAALAEDPRGVI